VREGRRRQAEDALTVERDREAMLVAELEDVLAAAGGAALDSRIYARMDPEEVALVRTALGQGSEPEPDDEPDPNDDGSGLWADWDESAESPADEDELEAEVARLRDEIDSSRSAQAALSRYLELVAAGESG